MRNKYFVLAIIGIGLLAIVVTGFGTGGMGGITGGASGAGASGDTLVTIGNEKITDGELREPINGLFRQTVERDPTTNRETWVDSAFGPLVDDVISERALVAFAHAQGFVVPDEMINNEIVAIPQFQNAAGDFDPDTFRRVLSQNQLSEARLRQNIEYAQLIRMVAAPVTTGGVLPQAVTNEYANLLLEKRVGVFGVIPTVILARSINPSEEEVARYYQQNVAQFQLPERRVIRYILIGREQLGDRVRASDQEVQAYYGEHQAEYGARETRNVQLFTAQDEAAARAFADRVNGGASFEDAARPAGFTPEDVNLAGQTKEQVAQRSDPNFANGVFAAQPNQLVGPQRTESGFQVARVTAVNHTAGRDLASVRAEIVAAIETRKLTEQLGAANDRIQTQLDDGASLDEVAQAEHLPILETAPVTATGVAQNLQFPRELMPMVQEAFDMTAGDNPRFTPVQADKSAAVVTVGRIVPPAAPPLAEIKDQVRARMINQMASQRARQLADQIVQRINAGATPADAFRAVAPNMPGPQERTLQRSQIVQAGQQVPPHFRLLFTLPDRRAHALPAPAGAGWVVVYNQQRTPGNVRTSPDGQQLLRVTQRAIQDSGENELRDQFARAVGAHLGITRNEAGIEALRQSLRAGR